MRPLSDRRIDQTGFRRGKPVRTRAEMTFEDQPLESRYPHHKKLVEIRVEDGQKLDPLEQRDAVILRFLEYAPIELEPGELTIEQPSAISRGI